MKVECFEMCMLRSVIVYMQVYDVLQMHFQYERHLKTSALKKPCWYISNFRGRLLVAAYRVSFLL